MCSFFLSPSIRRMLSEATLGSVYKNTVLIRVYMTPGMFLKQLLPRKEELDERLYRKGTQPVSPLTVEQDQKCWKPQLDRLSHMQCYLRQKSPECPNTGMMCFGGTQWLSTRALQPNCLNSNISLNSHLLGGHG